MTECLLPKDPDERSRLIEHMLSAVEDEMSDKGRSNAFIESLRDQFDRKAWLSDKQIEALSKFYARAT